MEKIYDPKQIEKHWAKYWEKNNFTKPSGSGEPYCIMLPPPNVTGTLHMGHGFQHTLMDALIRKHRMMGNNTLWQAGTDHAGIATQMVVERQLAKEGLSRHDLGREKFLDKIWDWRKQSGSTITSQIRRMGASIDWERERFSMDNHICKATREAFIRLHEQGLIYRGKRLVNWDPQLKTAISDLEVSSELSAGHLWHIRYPLANSDEHLVIATTRPETLLGDTGVAVHPEDPRYLHLIGKSVALPLTGRNIPIVSDDAVDPEFGTGCVKITPAHDFTDYEIGQRNDLPILNILTLDAHLNDEVPEEFRGLDRFVARKKVVKALETLGLLEKVEDHPHNIPKGDRSGAIIEPMLTDQWFLKTETLAKPAIEAVKSGKLTFTPKNWSKTYLQWLENIQDWCISRQVWWGHRIPVWYDEQQNVYVGHSEQDVRKRYKLPDELSLEQDHDVLDTWFSAALWPFSSLGWPEKTPELETFYPTNVLVTGFDIIFFWVARMVMMGLHLVGDIPFREVYITGLIRDSHGQKMSKTKGNILDPIDLVDGIELEPLIKKRCDSLIQAKNTKKVEQATRKEFPNGIASYGTDALRFTFCALASTGRDINFDMGRIEGYRNFCNKIWNATRYITMNTEGEPLSQDYAEYTAIDQWIFSRLQHTISQVEQAFQQFRFDLLAQTLYEFTWNEYCDWYLEFSKCIINDPNTNPAKLYGTLHTMIEVLEILMRLMHPLMPYITEEIWQKIAPMLEIKEDSIMLQPYPTIDPGKINKTVESEIEWLKTIITAIRTLRSEMHISPAIDVPVIFDHANETDRARIEQYRKELFSLAKIKTLEFKKEEESLPLTMTAVVNHLEIHIPLAGFVDQDAELKRLQKKMNQLLADQKKSKQKLDNKNYTQKAPKEIIEKEQKRLLQTEQELEKLQAHHERLSSIAAS